MPGAKDDETRGRRSGLRLCFARKSTVPSEAAGRTAARQMPPGCGQEGSPEGRAGQCLRRYVFCPCRVSAGMGKGVALTARGPELAGWRPHPTGVGLARTRSWLIHRPLIGALRPGCPGRGSGLDPREMLWARIPARTLRALLGDAGPLRRDRPGSSHRARHVRHRPGPISRPRPHVADGSGPGPVAGFARRSRAPPASGTALAIASPLVASYVETRITGAFPSAWPETLARPSGSGSATMIACGWKVGKKLGAFSGK